jgi:hypothetical protein
MTSSPERTAMKTLVASIVALHGNGCKQASYSVHVTIGLTKQSLEDYHFPAIYFSPRRTSDLFSEIY